MSAEQRQHSQKRQSESESQDSGDRKCPRLEGDTLTSQFEALTFLAQEIQDMGVQLGQVATDVAATQELVRGLVATPQAPCRICCACEERSIYSDHESQLP